MTATSNDQHVHEGGRARGNLRDDIALALDGSLPEDPSGVAIAYQVAAERLGERLEPGLGMLRDPSWGPLALLGSRFDEIRLFAGQLGVEMVVCNAVSDVPVESRVVIAGCQRSPVVGQAIERWLDGGAIVITSDKSAGLAPVADLLGARIPGGPRRARLALAGASRESSSGFDLSTVPVLPAVRLAPGHIPIMPRVINDDGVILARDVLTGDPLAVAMPVSNGYLIHSVPHWWQSERHGKTAVEQRRLREIPELEVIGRDHPDLTLGAFTAASAMLLTLANGLAAALGRPLDAQPRVR